MTSSSGTVSKLSIKIASETLEDQKITVSEENIAKEAKNIQSFHDGDKLEGTRLEIDNKYDYAIYKAIITDDFIRKNFSNLQHGYTADIFRTYTNILIDNRKDSLNQKKTHHHDYGKFKNMMLYWLNCISSCETLNSKNLHKAFNYFKSKSTDFSTAFPTIEDFKNFLLEPTINKTDDETQFFYPLLVLVKEKEGDIYKFTSQQLKNSYFTQWLLKSLPPFEEIVQDVIFDDEVEKDSKKGVSNPTGTVTTHPTQQPLSVSISKKQSGDSQPPITIDQKETSDEKYVTIVSKIRIFCDSNSKGMLPSIFAAWEKEIKEENTIINMQNINELFKRLEDNAYNHKNGGVAGLFTFSYNFIRNPATYNKLQNLRKELGLPETQKKTPSKK